MTRGIGEFGLQELIPEWAAILVALLTQLGDVWFLAIIVGAVYWLHTNKREEAAVVIGLTLAGFAVLTALKYTFALPRPDQPLVQLEALPATLRPLYEATGTATGYGFPSGHAFMTTVVYVSLARRLSVGTGRQRLLGAATVITAVCLSRVALGVHYLVDVVAGVAGGLVVLFVAEWTVRAATDRTDRADRGTVAFALAVVASAGGLVVSSDDPDAVLLLGASLGAFGGWQLVRLGELLYSDGQYSRTDRPVVLRAGLAVAAFAPLLGALGYFGVFSPSAVSGTFGLFSPPAVGGALGVALAAAIAVPLLQLVRSSGPSSV